MLEHFSIVWDIWMTDVHIRGCRKSSHLYPSTFSFYHNIFYCPTSFQREWAAFLGSWCPPPVFRSCLSCSAVKWSFDELVGEKVISLFYSFAIFGPPPAIYFFTNLFHISLLFHTLVLVSIHSDLWTNIPFCLFVLGPLYMVLSFSNTA